MSYIVGQQLWLKARHGPGLDRRNVGETRRNPLYRRNSFHTLLSHLLHLPSHPLFILDFLLHVLNSSDATGARIGRRARVMENELVPRSVRRKRSNTMPSETPSLPSRRRRRSLPLSSVKQRRSEWHEERGERKYSLMKSYKPIIGETTSTLFSFFYFLTVCYNVGTDSTGLVRLETLRPFLYSLRNV